MRLFSKISFLLFALSICIPGILKSQCDTINLGNDTVLCHGQILQLDAGSGFYSYLWNNGTTGQFLTVEEPGEYWCIVEDLDSTNIINNGDFSSGNTGFYTDYIWGIGGPWGILSEEGTYVIDENAANTHIHFSPCVDNTSGDGLYMIVNGDTTQNENVWCQSTVVEPNTTYLFSGWFTSVHPSNPAILSYFINEAVIETVYLTGTTCYWQNFVKEWNSASNSTAEVCIINQNTELGGNDFGIDDIHLLKMCVSSDTIIVEFDPSPPVDLGNDTTLCEGQELQLNAGSGYSQYLWSTGSVDSSIVVTGSELIWLEVVSETGCVWYDTIFIDFVAGVEIDLGNDTTICQGESLLLDAGSVWESILWFNGSTGQTITISDPGNYWVMVTDNNGCSGMDTILVELSPAVVVSLGGDTTLCIGDDYILNPGENFTSYLWQDGSTGAYYTIVNSGVYWVEVTDIYGCNGADTVSIDFVPSPEVNLGNDTTICSGTTLTLNPGTQYSSYLWQDNSTLPQYTVNTTGFYSVTVTNVYNCPASDEIFIEITSPDIDLGPDTLLCIGDTLLLDPGQGYVSYLWQDNTTQSQYTVLNGGVYNVTVTDTYNCTTIDTVSIEGHSKPEADLGEDQPLCEGESILLETIQGPYEYSWNGIPGDHTLEVSTGGTYTVEVSNQCGMITDQIDVTEFPVPSVNLGQDQVIFEGDVLELDAGEGFDNYVWQDGSGEQYFIITESNYNTDDPYYYVEVTDGPCKSSDTTRIILFRVKIPNVFTPNGDNKNDKFVPMEDGWNGVNSHHIEIFNRWGEKVWESDDFESGWDGKRNGNYVSDGTYFWVLDVYYGETSITQRVKGTVNILREE